MMRRAAAAFGILLLVFAVPCSADVMEEELISPKEGWGDLEGMDEAIEEDDSPSIVSQILLWPVNRFLDLVDVVRLDVGAGTALGGVVRVTRSGSMGYRHLPPGSLRVGSFGRKSPVMVERKTEKGFGPNFKHSTDRDVCTSEIGVGLDLGLGGYFGICLEHLVDFAGGIVFLDPDNDDL